MKFSDCVGTGKYNQIVSENDSFARNIGLQVHQHLSFIMEQLL